MAVHSRTTLEWSLEITPVDGVGSTLVFESGGIHHIRPAAWKLDQREDVASSTLEIRFPDATQFFNIWNDYNPLAPGSKVVLKVDSITRFTGWIKSHSARYSAEDRGVTVVARDRMDVKDACVAQDMRRRVLFDVVRLVRQDEDSQIWLAWDDPDTPVTRLLPWPQDYIIPVWIGDPEDIDASSCPIQLSEYDILYEQGGIAFKYGTVRCVGDDSGDEQDLDDVEDEIYAGIAYFDSTDDSTMISNLLRDAFETAVVDGGLGWTEGVEYDIDDETTGDILSGMRWITDEGDGDMISYLSNMYDNPLIGLSPSYWIRDFNGNGKVNARLVAQDNDSAIDVDIIFDSSLPNPFESLYSRVVLVGNSSTRANLMRDATVTDIFSPPVGITFSMTYDADGGPVEEENLYDGSAKTSWGYCSIGKAGQHDIDMKFPNNTPLFKVDFGAQKYIDSVYYCCHFTFTDGEDQQPALYDNVNGLSANQLKLIHRNQKITVEWSNDDTNWFTLHSDLFYQEVDILDARNGWHMTEGIGIEARYLRVVVNEPLFAKVGESGFFDQEAFRVILYFMSEFIVLGRGRVLDDDDALPEVKFVEEDDDELRCRYNLADELVDMYRPHLLAKLEAAGLKWKTLVIESDDVFDFSVEHDADPDNVGLGYKLLVTRLDAASKENEWTVRIDPRPDVRIGSTVYCSRLDPDKMFLVMGNSLQMNGGNLSQTLILSDYESVDGDEPTEYCE